MNSENQSIYAGLILDIGKNIHAVKRDADKVKDARSGTYNSAVDLAILVNQNGDGVAELDAAFESVFEQIRKNGNVARAVGAERRKEESKDGDKYVVPSAFSTVRSVLKDALTFGCDLVNESTGNPISFNAIRKDVREIKAAIRKEKEMAELSPAEVQDRDLRARLKSEYLADLAKLIDRASGERLDRIAEAVMTCADTVAAQFPKVTGKGKKAATVETVDAAELVTGDDLVTEPEAAAG